MLVRRVFALVLIWQLFIVLPVAAQTAPAAPTPLSPSQSSAYSGSVTSNKSLNLDLSSTSATLQASTILHNGTTAVINVGGTNVHVSSNSILTPAEMAAVYQVSSMGHQAVQLSSTGTAVAGMLLLNAPLYQVSSMVIPTGVTVVNDFAKSGQLNIIGNLLDSGALYAVSTNQAVNMATINAANIVVKPGAVLTTVIPPNGFAGLSGLVNNLNLTLNASHDIVNQGTISSAGNLTIIAGNSLSNTSATASSPVIHASGALNLQSPSIVNGGSIISEAGSLSVDVTNLINNGLLQSVGSDVNISNSIIPGAALSINSSSAGIIEALNGTISVKQAGDINIAGGNLYAQKVLLDAGQTGNLNLVVNDASGAFYVSAGAAKLQVNQGTNGFNLASFNVTGDPDLIYNGSGDYNYASGFNADGGYVDINTTGAITFGGAIDTTPTAAGAGGYVSLNAGTSISVHDIVTSANTNGAAGSITLNAGGDISTGNLTAVGASGGSNGNITVTAGTSSAGALTSGSVSGNTVSLTSNGNMTLNGSLNGSSNVSLTTQGTGNITVPSGTITTPTLSVSTAGGNLGASASPISTKVTNAALNIGGTGSAYISNSNTINLQSSSVGGTLLVQANGNVTTSAAIAATDMTLKSGAANGNITIGGNLTGSNSITLTATGSGNIDAAGNTLATNSLTMSSGTGNIGSSGYLNTAAAKISVNTGGSGNVQISQTGALTVGTSSAGGNFNLKANGPSVILSNPITAGGNLSIIGTGTNTSITFNANPTVGALLSLTTTGSGSISQSTGLVLTAPSIQINNGSADIGLSTSPFQVATSNLSVSTSGSAYFSNNSAINLQGSSVGGTLLVQANGNVTTSGAVAAIDMTLKSIATSGNITIGGNLTGSNSITLIASGSGNIDAAGNTLATNSLTMSSGTGNIGSSGYLNTAATTIIANTGGSGNVQINQTGAVTLGSSSAGGNFNLELNASGFTVTNPITAGGNLSIIGTGTNTSIVVSTNPSVGGLLTLTATGSGTVTSGVVLAAPSIQINSGSADIGSQTTPFQVSTANLSFHTAGNAYFSNSTNLAIQSSSATGILEVLANGNISTTGAIAAHDITLQSLAANGGISVGANLNAVNGINLLANGYGNINNPTGTITAASLQMSSGSGSIGQSGFINTAANSITATTGGSGNISINQTGTFTLQASSAGGNFNLQINAPSFSLSNSLTAGGNVSIVGTGSNFSLAINSNPSVGGTLKLAATGTGTITEANGLVIAAPTLNLNGGSAAIGSGATPLQVSSANLSANSSGSVYLSNNLDARIQASTVTGTFQLLNSGNIQTTGTISAGVLALQSTATNGSIIIGSTVGGTTSSQLTASGAGTITYTGGTIKGGPATLTTSGGAIGTSTAPIEISSSTVNASAASGAIYLDIQASSNVNNVSSSSSIQISGAAAYKTTGTISAPNIVLQSSNSSGGISIGSNVSASNSISVQGLGSASIIQAGGMLSAPTISLTSASGQIGTSANAVQTTATNLSASTGGASSVYVNNSGAVIIGNSAAGATLQFSATADMQVNGTINAPTISLKTTANNGSVTLNTAVNASGGLTVTTNGTGNVVFNQAISTTPTTPGNGGNVAITAGGGLSFTSISTLSNGTSSTGTAGNVTLTAGGLIFGSGAIDASVATTSNGVSSGNVSLNGGSISIQDISVSNANGAAGSIYVTAAGSITTGNLKATSVTNGGSVAITGNAVQVNGGIDTYSTTVAALLCQGGDVTIHAAAGVSVAGQINASSLSGLGGALLIKNTTSGDISLGGIDTSSTGQVARGTDGWLNSSGGSITIQQSGAGNVTVNGGVNSSGQNTAFGGNIAIGMAGGALSIANAINSSSANHTAGKLDIYGSASSIGINTSPLSTVAINTQGGGGSKYYSGDVSIIANGAAVTVNGDINTVGSAGAGSGNIVVDNSSSIVVSENIFTSNSALGGGTVLLQASGNISVNNISTDGGAGTGGVITASAGTAGTGNLTVGTLSATGVGTNNSGGAITLMAAGDLNVNGTVTTNGSNGAFGGAVTLTAGYQPYSTLPGGTGNITYGNISTTGTWGGNVSIVSLGTSGTINNSSSTITTDVVCTACSNGIAGSVSITSPGPISAGNISAQSSVGAAAYAGSVFISSGASGTAVTVSGINTNSSGTAGNIFIVVNPTSSISINTTNISQTGTTANTINSSSTNGYLFDDPSSVTVTSSITGTMTASFGTTVTGYNPGGYLTANDPTAQLTVYTSGDTRLMVPIAVLSGSLNISTLSSGTLTSGSTVYASPLAVYAPGNITIANPVSAVSVGAAAPPVNLVSTIGTVTIPSLSLGGDPSAQVVLSSPTSFSLQGGLSFNSSTGSGGIITISVPSGSITLGTSGSTSTYAISANGVSGGIITLDASANVTDYGVALTATGTSGSGGTVNIISHQGQVYLYNEYGGSPTSPATIDVSSSTGSGGTINIYGRYGVSVLPDGVATATTTQVLQANGYAQGGTVNISSQDGLINLADNQSVNVTASKAGGTAGSIYLFAPIGSISTNNLNASSDNGGKITAISSTFQLSNGSSITVEGLNGNGGAISLYTGGVRSFGNGMILGSADNRTGNSIIADGTASGGTIAIESGSSLIDYEVGISANSTFGPAGTITITADRGNITLYDDYWSASGTNYNFNSQLTANSSAVSGSVSNYGAGGSITINSAIGTVYTLRDTTNGYTGNASTQAIAANGTTSGGSLTITAGDIVLSDTNRISAVGSASGSAGGTIAISTNGNVDNGSISCCSSASTSVITAQGASTGGSITMTSSGGHVDLTNSLDVTASAAGTTGGTVSIKANNSWVTTTAVDAYVPGGSVTITAGGTLTNLGVIGGDTVTMSTVANSGNILLGGAVNGLTSATISANGSGSIENTLGYGKAVVAAPTVSLSSQSGSIGAQTPAPPYPAVQIAASLDPLFVFVNGGNLTAAAGGDIYLNSLAPTVNLIGTSHAGTNNNNFMLESSGNITVTGSVTAGSTATDSSSCCGYTWTWNYGMGNLTLETYGGTGNITISGTANGWNEAQLLTAGTGAVSVLSGGAINSNSEVYIRAYGLNLQGSIFSQSWEKTVDPSNTVTLSYSGWVQLVPNGSQSVALGDSTGSTGIFDVPQNAFAKITTESLNIGDQQYTGSAWAYINTGDIKVYGNINLTGTLGSPGVYGLSIETGGNFDATGFQVSLSTGANDYHTYAVTVGGSMNTGSASGGYYQQFTATGAINVNGVLDNTNSLYQWNEIDLTSNTNIIVQSTAGVNSTYVYFSAPAAQINGYANGSGSVELQNYSYMANNVPQPTYGLAISGTGSITAPTIYLSDEHYTYDPVTFNDTEQGGWLSGTIGQLNGNVYVWADAGATAGTGTVNLATTSGNMTVESVSAPNSIVLATDGAHQLSFLSPSSGGMSTMSAGNIQLTSGSVIAPSGLAATAGTVVINSPSGYGLTLSSNSGSLSIQSTAGNTIQATDGVLNINSGISSTGNPAGSVLLTLQANGNSGGISINAGSQVSADGALQVNTPNLTVATGAQLTGPGSITVSNSGSPMVISNSGTLSSRGGQLSFMNDQSIAITAGSGSTTSGSVIAVASSNSSISLAGTYHATSSMNLSGATGVTSTGTAVGLDTPLLTVSGGAGAISIAGTNAGVLTANTSGAVSVTDTNSATITLNPSSGSSFTVNASNSTSAIVGGGALNSATVSLAAGSGGIDFNTSGYLNASNLSLSSSANVIAQDKYAGVINLGTSTASSFTLIASDTASGVSAISPLSAPTINITTGTGGINFSKANAVNATSVTASSSGIVYIDDTATSTVTLKASQSGASSAFTLNATGAGITTAGAISGNDIMLSANTASGSAVTIGANINANNSLTVNANANISDSASSITVNAPTITFTAGNGNIVLSGAYTASSTTLTAANGQVSSSNATTGLQTTSLSLTSGTGAGIDIASTSATNLTINANGGGAASIMDTANTGITLNSGLAGSLILADSQSNSGISGNGGFTAGTINVTVGGGSIDFNTFGYLNTPNLSLNSSGNVIAHDKYAGQISLGASSANSFTLIASDTASGISATASLNAPTINITAGSGGISFAAPNSINATSVTVNSTGTVYIDDTATSTINLYASQSGTSSAFTLNATGAGITTAGAISGNDITLSASTAAGSSVSIGANITANNSLIVNSDANISDSSSSIAINAPTVTFTSASGNIVLSGGYTASSITLSAASGQVSSANTATGLQTTALALTSGTAAGINIASTSATSLTINANSGGTASVTDTANGSITLNSGSAGSLMLSDSQSNSGISGNGGFTAGTINLTAGGGGIDFNTSGYVNASNLSLNSSGTVIAQDKYAGVINLGASAGNSFTLTASDAASGLSATAPLNAPTINITTGSGGVNFTAPNSVNATSVTVSSTGTVYIDDTATSTVNLYGSKSGASSAFTLNATGAGIATLGAISGKDITLSANTASGAAVLIGANITANNSVIVNSDGNITDSGSSVVFNAPTMTFTSSNGNIILSGGYTASSVTLSAANGQVSSANTATGLQTTDLAITSGAAGISIASTSATNLTINSNSGGSASVTDTANVSITLNSGSVGSLALSDSQSNSGINGNGGFTAGTINVTVGGAGIDFKTAGYLNASNLSLSSAGNVVAQDKYAGVINLGASAGNSFTLTASDVASGLSASAPLNAPTINITSGSGGINFTAPNSVNATSVTVNSTGTIYIDDTATSAVALNGSHSGTSAAFTFNAVNSPLSVTGALSGGSISLTVSNGSLSIGNNIGDNSTTSASLAAGGAITQSSGVLEAGTLTISSGADVGAANARIVTQAGTMSISSGANAFVRNNGSLIIGPVSISGIFDAQVNGNISTAGNLTSAGVNLATVTGSNGGISISNAVSSSGAINLNSNGTGGVSISSTVSTTSGNVAINAGSLNLTGQIVDNDTSANVLVQSANQLTLLGIGSVSANALSFQAPTITFGSSSNYSVTASGQTLVHANTVVMQSNSSLNSTNSNGFGLAPLSGSSLEIAVPDNSSSTISTSGGAINISTGTTGSISIVNLVGTGIAALHLNGGPVNINPAGGSFSVGTNVSISTTGAITISAQTITNDGSVNTSSQLTASNSSGLSINGAGSLSAATLTVSSANGAVSINQSQVNGVLSGSAGTSFSASVTGADLNVAGISASNGNISLSSASHNLAVVDSGALTATASVLLSGGNISIGTSGGSGVSINAGTLTAGADSYSTDLSQYDYSSVAKPGAVLFSSAGSITLGDNVGLTSRGGSIGMTANAGGVGFGANDNLFAQAGNVWINASGSVNLGSGAKLTAVARNLPGTTFTMTSAGLNVTNFAGGDIGINVSAMVPNYDSYLHYTFDANRSRDGIISVTNGIPTASDSLNTLNGGTINFSQSASGKIVPLNDMFIANGGVIQLDPPGGTISMSGATLTAIGPVLIPLPTPPAPVNNPPAVVPVATTAPQSSGTSLLFVANLLSPQVQSVIAAGSSAKTVPLDENRYLAVSPYQPTYQGHQCVPVAMAEFSEGNGWSVAGGACQSFAVHGDTDAAIIAEGGSSVGSMGNHTLDLKNGTLVAMTGKNSLTVGTGNGTTVYLAANSTFMIQQTPNGVVRVTQLAGPDGKVTVKSAGKDAAVSTGAGREVVVANDNCPEEDLIPVDGVDRAPIGASLSVASLRVRKNAFDTRAMVERNKFLNCNGGCFPTYVRNRLNQAKLSMMQNRSTSQSMMVPSGSKPVVGHSQTPLRPVAFSSLPASSPSQLMSLNLDFAVVKQIGNSAFAVAAPGKLDLLEAN